MTCVGNRAREESLRSGVYTLLATAVADDIRVAMMAEVNEEGTCPGPEERRRILERARLAGIQARRLMELLDTHDAPPHGSFPRESECLIPMLGPSTAQVSSLPARAG